jgi:hypothetical protein
MPIDEQPASEMGSLRMTHRSMELGCCCSSCTDVCGHRLSDLGLVVVDLSLIRRINLKGSASIAVPNLNAAGNRAASPDLLVRRRKAAATQSSVHVTRSLWLLIRLALRLAVAGTGGRVDMLTHQLMPRELVFAAAIAVPLETVPTGNDVRLAALLMISLRPFPTPFDSRRCL